MALIATKISNAVSDNTRLVKGKYISSAGGASAANDGDYIVCEIPKRALITFIVAEIATAFATGSTGTVTLGYKEPGQAIVVAGFANNATVAPSAAGFKVANTTRYFPNGGVITMSVTNGDYATAVKAAAYVEYAVVS